MNPFFFVKLWLIFFKITYFFTKNSASWLPTYLLQPPLQNSTPLAHLYSRIYTKNIPTRCLPDTKSYVRWIRDTLYSDMSRSHAPNSCVGIMKSLTWPKRWYVSEFRVLPRVVMCTSYYRRGVGWKTLYDFCILVSSSKMRRIR